MENASLCLPIEAQQFGQFHGANGHRYSINPFAIATARSSISYKETVCKIMEVQAVNAEVASVNYCKPCNMIFEQRNFFVKHNNEMHNKKKHQCYFCETSFNRHDHLTRHVKSLHSNDRYPCGLCKEDFARRDLVMRHMKRIHPEQSPVFQCKDCRGQYTLMAELEEHERSSHLLADRHTCPHCSVTFKRRDHMLRHVKSQHLNHVIGCPVCSQQYKRRDHLTRHLREKHNIRS